MAHLLDRSVIPDYYALLGIAPDADHEIVRAAYLVLVKRYHPDAATADSPPDVDKFQLIAEAYELLRDPDRRAQYDKHHSRQARLLAQRERFEHARRLAREQAQQRQGWRSQEEQEPREARAESRWPSAVRNFLVFSGGFAMAALVVGLVQALAPDSRPATTDLATHTELTEVLQALQRAERLATTYQEMLAQERARSRGLEDQLVASRDATASLPAAPDPTRAPATDKPATAPLPTSETPVLPASDRPATMAARPTAPEAPGNTEPARLMARASLLLDQGNIGAARIVLERAAEMGSAPALFALAETYDPAMLSAWGTFGTRGDVGKARELYAKAFAGGIQEAGDRLNASR